jgi:hypothetical protein
LFTRSTRLAFAAAVFALGASGCATQTYVVAEPGSTTTAEQQATALSASLDGADATAVAVRLSGPTCRTVDVTQYTATTYSKPSTGGAIALIAGGAALAALGTASWIAGEKDPAQCAANDDSCVTRTQAKVAGGVLWGVGAGGIGWGTYRLLESPKVTGQRTYEKAVPESQIVHDCAGTSLAGVQVSLAYRLGTLTADTDESGRAVFPACGPDVTGGCVDVSQMFSTDRGAFSTGAAALGSVELGKLLGARDPAPPSPQVDEAVVQLLAAGLCAAKLWGEDKCAEQLGAVVCNGLQQAMTQNGQINMGALFEAGFIAMLSDRNKMFSYLATTKEFLECLPEAKALLSR